MSERNSAPATGFGWNIFGPAMPPKRDYRKKIILYTALAWMFFSGGILFRYLQIPNQALIAAAGMFLFIFASLVFVLKQNLQADDDIPAVWHKAGYGSTALVFWGYLHGWERDDRFWAFVFYAALVLMISPKRCIKTEMVIKSRMRKQGRQYSAAYQWQEFTLRKMERRILVNIQALCLQWSQLRDRRFRCNWRVHISPQYCGRLAQEECSDAEGHE